MEEKWAYYLAAGRSLATIEAILEQRRECNVRRRAFKDHFDADALIYLAEEVIGATFADASKVPKGWKRCKAVANGWRPKETQQNRALLREMRDTLRWDASSKAGKDYIEGCRFYFATFEKVGNQHVIYQHEKAEPPPDAIPLKRSDYWRVKEEANAARPAEVSQ